MKLKRLNVSWASEKKAKRFIIAPRGPHKLQYSLPLLVVVRDLLKIADTALEAKKIITSKKVKVDGKICRDPKHGLGLFDSVQIGEQAYRVLPRAKKLVPIDNSEASQKICQVIGKKAVRGGKIQISLHDGRNILFDKSNYKPLDSLLISVPDQKVKDHIPFKEGAAVYVRSGVHIAEVALLKKIERENNRVWLEVGGKQFEAPLNGAVPLGTGKSLIKVDQ